MILTREEWISITSRGTSGDQVDDILASWKYAETKYKLRIEELENTLRDIEKLAHIPGNDYQGALDCVEKSASFAIKNKSE